jgi:hypothetical protein
MSYDQIGTRFNFGYPELYRHSLVINSNTILECYADIFKFVPSQLYFTVHCQDSSLLECHALLGK